MFRSFPSRRRPLLFAHRGASREAPENTLEAFAAAVRLGVDVLEMDAHMTADGEVVVLHDADVRRTTDGHGPVRNFTLAQLQKLDAGARFRSATGAASFAGRGVIIPRLEDVLRAFPQMGFNIEVKQLAPTMIRKTLAVLDSVGSRDVVLAAGNHPIMQALEAARPGCPLGLSGTQAWQFFWTGLWGSIPRAWKGRALQVPTRHRGLPVMFRRTIRRAHAAGLDVYLWTINSVREARFWLERGVDGIISDDPAAIAPAFASQRSAQAAAEKVSG